MCMRTLLHCSVGLASFSQCTHRPMLPPPYGSDQGAVGWPSELWVLANVISFSNLSTLPTETVTTVLNTMARCLDVRTCVHVLAYICG